MTQWPARWIVIAVCLLSLAAGGCEALGDMGAKPTASITDAQLQDITLRTVTLLFDVKVDNPYSVDLPLTDVTYSLASQGAQFLNGQADLTGAIPARGSKVLPVPVTVDFVQLLSRLRNVRPGQTIPYTADLGLMVKTPLLGLMKLPVTRSGQLKVPSLSDLPLP